MNLVVCQRRGNSYNLLVTLWEEEDRNEEEKQISLISFSANLILKSKIDMFPLALTLALAR